MKKYITKKELSIIMSLSTPKIDKDMKKGLPFHKFGRSVRFIEDEVMAWYKSLEKE